ncbi:MAG: hypothetical protein M3132_14895 [Actinomycetia bacterium]|nr:hypothetical protein [Actinomycetes bacterium]
MDRYEYEVLTEPPWLTVTDSRPATDPAKVTVPPPMVVTFEPGGWTMSMPQCPRYSPIGA